MKEVKIGVPQGSILGPLLFLIYINDLPNACRLSTCFLYADDTAIFFESNNLKILQSSIDNELPKLCEWLQVNKLSLNTDKTVYQIYNNSQTKIDVSVKLDGVRIRHVEKVKYLGLYIDSELNWKYHIDYLTSVLSRNIGTINRAKFFVDKKHLLLLYNSLVLPYINYCCLVWGHTFPTYLHKIETLQKRAVRIIDQQHWLAHSNPIFGNLKLLKVKDIAQQQTIMVMHRKITRTLPDTLDPLFMLTDRNCNIVTRRRNHFDEKFTEKLYRTRIVTWIGPRIWNRIISLNYSIQEVAELSKCQLKNVTKKHFLNTYEE